MFARETGRGGELTRVVIRKMMVEVGMASREQDEVVAESADAM